MLDFTKGNVALLILASKYYGENDYMRNYDFYLDEAKNILNT
ncbi:WxcM-like domain-containing protein [Clostridium beijerinckii]|nr:WxcM-like domain-containing protein [Clostridium beijerinckii]